MNETITLEKKALFNLISLVTMATAEIYQGEDPTDNVKSAMQNQMLYDIVPSELQEHILSVIRANYNAYDKIINPII